MKLMGEGGGEGKGVESFRETRLSFVINLPDHILPLRRPLNVRIESGVSFARGNVLISIDQGEREMVGERESCSKASRSRFLKIPRSNLTMVLK